MKQHLQNSIVQTQNLQRLKQWQTKKPAIYNVDSKSEIVKIISEDIEALEREVEYLTPEIYEPEYDY